MLAELIRAVDERVDDLHDLAARLVRERSLLGCEEGAQRIVAERLATMGFDVERVQPDPSRLAADDRSGLPLLPYEGRTCVAARLGGAGRGRSLHLSGHVDVVPVEAEDRWTHSPWGGEIAGGRMWGRGAGDMKAGLAAYLVGIEALLAVGGRPEGDLLFTSVIEEECGGNGMLAVVQAGYEADATLIGEPTDLRLHANGVGILWARLTARSGGAHAAFADPGDSPLDRILAAVQALRVLERELNAGRDGHPYNLNLGEIHGGAWPSSVPAEVTLRFRLGYGPEVGPGDAQKLVARAVAASAPTLELAFEGFRTSAYEHELEGALPELLRSCHRELHGADPGTKVSTATTDARFVSGPCLCYGPAAGNLHGIDEWVDLASVRDTAVAVALVASRWCGVSSRP